MMKNIILIAILIAQSAIAQSVFVPGFGGTWKAPVDNYGSLPLTDNRPGDARADKFNGNIYVWNGSNWDVIGGGSGAFSSITGTANEIAYFNGSGNGTGDVNATRIQNDNFDTSIGSFVNETVLDNSGTYYFTTVSAQSGALVTLVFNGTTDTRDSVVNAWNTGNPSNQITVSGGTGADVLTAQTITLSSATSGYIGGQYTVPVIGAPLQGSGFASADLNNNFALNLQGNLSQLFGIGGISSASIVANVPTNNISFILQSPGMTQMFVQSNTYQGTINFDALSGALSAGFSDLGFFADDANRNVGWQDGSNRYFFPIGSLPSVNQVVSVSNVSGNNVQLAFTTPSAGGLPTGTQEFQYLKWDTGTSLPVWNNLYAVTEDFASNFTTALGYNALGLTATNSTPKGQYANTAIGTATLSNLAGTQDNRNTAVGNSAGSFIPQSTRSTYVGYQVYGDGAVTSIDGAFFGADVIIHNSTGNSFFGVAGNVAGTNNSAFGYQNLINGTNNIILGSDINISSAGSSSQNILIGKTIGNSLSSGSNNLMMGFGGPGNLTTANNNILMFGGNNISTGDSNIAMGAGSGQTISTGYDNIILGVGADVSGSADFQSIAIGQAAITNTGGIALGAFTSANSFSIAMGNGAATTNINQFVAGSNNAAMTDVWFGQGQNGQGAWTLHGSEPLQSANASGGDLTILAGRGTGLQGGGELKLASSFPGISSGTTPGSVFVGFSLAPQGNRLTIGDPYDSLGNRINLNFDYNGSTLDVSNASSGFRAQQWDINNGFVYSGDVDGNASQTLQTIDFFNGIIRNAVSSSFSVEDTTGNKYIQYIGGSQVIQLGNDGSWHTGFKADNIAETTTIGDVWNNNNGTKTVTDDGGASITSSANNSFNVQDTNGNPFLNLALNGGGPTNFTVGDIGNRNNGTQFLLQDSLNRITLFSNEASIKGSIIEYNGQSVASNGVVSLPIVHNSIGESSGATWPNIYFTPNESLLRVSVYAVTSTAGSAGTMIPNVVFVDETGTTQTISLPSLDLANVNKNMQGSVFIQAKTSTNISINPSYVGVTGSPAFNMHFSVERIQ